ncbi:hypothetical protein IAU60_002438 [Kwoniella sp. DSM 27419]
MAALIRKRDLNYGQYLSDSSDEPREAIVFHGPDIEKTWDQQRIALGLTDSEEGEEGEDDDNDGFWDSPPSISSDAVNPASSSTRSHPT